MQKIQNIILFLTSKSLFANLHIHLPYPNMISKD